MLQVCHVFKFFNPTELEKFKQIISFCAGNFENFLCWHSFVLDWTRIFGHCAGLDWTGVFEILGNTGMHSRVLHGPGLTWTWTRFGYVD